MLTLEQEANYLYLSTHYPVVVVLPSNAMYGADSYEDAVRLLTAEYDWQKPASGEV